MSPRRSRSEVHEAPAPERPRERLIRHGPRALTDAELLAVILRGGCRGQTALDVARDVLDDVDGLAGLTIAAATVHERPGIGAARAATLLATIELGCRLARAEMPRKRLLEHPNAVARYLRMRYADPDQEVVGAIFLDVRGRLVDECEIYRGTLSRAAVEPRGILKRALLHRASSFVLFHTHPSGDPSPSREDLAVTRRLADAGRVVGITLLDHLILGTAGRWMSVRNRGWV